MAVKKKPSVYTLALKQVQEANKDEQGQPLDQEPNRAGEQQEGMPMSQRDSISTSQHNTKSVSQQAGKQVGQEDGIPVNQHNTKTVSQPTGNTDDELIKATFYLTQDHIMKLEHIRLGRKQKGIKVDKSALVREAIDLL